MKIDDKEDTYPIHSWIFLLQLSYSISIHARSFFLRFPIITDKFHKRSYLFFFLSFIDAKNIVSRRLATRISEEEGFAPRVT